MCGLAWMAISTLWFSLPMSVASVVIILAVIREMRLEYLAAQEVRG